jgi:macrolide-specific efflux system membrane fusion protein
MRRGNDFDQIKQGDQLFPGQMFAQVVDPSAMLVSAAVCQSDVESVRIGAKATLRFDAFPGLELPAHVISIAAITRTGGMRANYYKEVPVFLKIDRMDPRVIPDLSVSADVVIAESPSTTIVPLESVFQDTPASKPFVYVQAPEGFQKREVELGLRNNIHTGVTSGLKAGETVALEPPRRTDGKASANASATPPAAKSGSNQES